jgi:hypothetical protein
MEAVLNIFNQDAFSTLELSKAIDLVPIKWGRIGELDVFPEQGVETTSVMVEYRNNQLNLLPTRPRGAPSTLGGVGRRYVKSFVIPHIPHEDVVRADEIQNVRAFGLPVQLETVQNVVNRKLLTMANKHDITLEHLRAGALSGIIYDADNATVLLNLFTEFGITPPVMYFNFGGPPTDEQMISNCNHIKRWMQDHLMGDTFDHVHALCSPTFFEKLISNPTVLEAYKLFTALQAVNPLRDDVRRRFVWQDIVWEEYRAYAGYEGPDGTTTTTNFIPDGDARFFPVGTTFSFATYFAPPTFLEGANLPGMKRYAKQAPEKFNRWIDLYTESNPLPLCMKPALLVRGNVGAGASNI